MSPRFNWFFTLWMVLMVLGSLAVSGATPVAAQTTEPPAQEPASAQEPAPAQEAVAEQEAVLAEEAAPAQDAAPAAEKPASKSDPCAPPADPDELWAARMRRGVFRTICGAATWVDAYFGDTRHLAVSEADEIETGLYGRLFFGMGYDEHEGIDPEVKLRARIPLPRLRNRFNALVGRGELDEVVSDRDQRFDRLPDALRETDDEWLLGLGYNPVRSTRFRLDFDAGVRIDFPIDPFVRTRLRRVFLLNDTQLVRLRETVFWRNAKGFGVTSAADFERIFAENLLVRSSVSGTFAQETDGVEYSASVTLFQNLNRGGAMAYKALAFGESDDRVPVREYGLLLIYRRPFLREWLFLEVAPGVGWRRRDVEDPREVVGSIRIGLDMLFGAGRPKP